MALCLFAGAALSACSDDPEPVSPADEAQQESQTKALARQSWLQSSDDIAPEVWLVARMTRMEVSSEDPEVARVAALLDAAGHRFRESPRMIANRAVQLQEMLAEAGIMEEAPKLVEDMSFIVDGASGAEGFGALCQHYYNLRSTGLRRDAALAALKRRYQT